MKHVYVHLNMDNMSLYDYVMYMYQSHFETNKVNKEMIKRYLNNCHAKYIKVSQFVEEYALSGRGIMGLLGVLFDVNRQDELEQFGLKCYSEISLNESEKESLKTL